MTYNLDRGVRSHLEKYYFTTAPYTLCVYVQNSENMINCIEIIQRINANGYDYLKTLTFDEIGLLSGFVNERVHTNSKHVFGVFVSDSKYFQGSKWNEEARFEYAHIKHVEPHLNLNNIQKQLLYFSAFKLFDKLDNSVADKLVGQIVLLDIKFKPTFRGAKESVKLWSDAIDHYLELIDISFEQWKKEHDEYKRNAVLLSSDLYKLNSSGMIGNFLVDDPFYYENESFKFRSLLKVMDHLEKVTEDLSHHKKVLSQPILKQKPEPNGKLITFKNSEAIEKIHFELKGYFPNKETELLKALQGELLSEILLFPHNQNKFVEVFRRLKYNGYLLNTDTETKNWICTTFQFVKKGFAEPQPFNESSVWDNLNKGKGEPTKKERICITEWLPYKSPLQLTRETENEKL